MGRKKCLTTEVVHTRAAGLPVQVYYQTVSPTLRKPSYVACALSLRIRVVHNALKMH